MRASDLLTRRHEHLVSPAEDSTYPPVQFPGSTADGSLTRLLRKIARVDVLVIDDWGLIELKPDLHRLFLEILEDRQGHGALLMTSQYPVNTWHERISDPTVADALLDRLISNAYTIALKGDSMRTQSAKTQ